MAKDQTLEVLKQIRDEVKKSNQRLQSLEVSHSESNQRLRSLEVSHAESNQRLGTIDQHLGGLDHRLERIEKRQSETEVRLATELVAVAGAVRELHDAIVEDRVLRRQVEAHEKRITALEEHPH